MDSNSFKNSNIIIDYNLKDPKGSNTNLKKMGKNKIKKIKYLYIDSNELTKDETNNKLEKNVDTQKKFKKQNGANKNKIILLKDKNNKNIKILKFKKCTSNDKDKVITEIFSEKPKGRNDKTYKIKNFKYFNKNDINYLLHNKAKTLNQNEEKNNKTKIIDYQNDCNSHYIEEESKQREHSMKEKSLYNPNSFNEEDLFNKIKKINFEKYIRNCYKTLKSAEDKNSNIVNNINSNKNNINDYNKKYKKHIQLKANNIFLEDNLYAKNILNSARSKMKAYTNISKLIKYNIMEKEKENKMKKIEIKQNYIINKNNNYIFNNYLYQDDTENTMKNQTNLILNLKENLEEKNDFEEVPQRRPGCSTQKNLYIMNKDIDFSKENVDTNMTNLNTKRNIRLKKNNYVTIQPKSTFTKSLKATRIINSNENKTNNLNKNLLKNIVQKFQTQRFKITNSNKKLIQSINKKNINSKTKSKTKKNDIKYLNLKDNFYKNDIINNNNNKNKITNIITNNINNNNKYVKYLNFTLINNKNINLNDVKVEHSIKNNSFSFGFKKPNSNYKLNRNSLFNKYHN